MFAASVCLSRGSSRLHCAKIAEQIKMLFGMNTPGGPRNIVLDVGPDAPTERGRGPVLNYGTPFGTAKSRNLKLCVHRGGVHNENYATVGRMSLGHVTYF